MLEQEQGQKQILGNPDPRKVTVKVENGCVEIYRLNASAGKLPEDLTSIARSLESLKREEFGTTASLFRVDVVDAINPDGSEDRLIDGLMNPLPLGLAGTLRASVNSLLLNEHAFTVGVIRDVNELNIDGIAQTVGFIYDH